MVVYSVGKKRPSTNGRVGFAGGVVKENLNAYSRVGDAFGQVGETNVPACE
jgi:hypothetical protein